MSQFNTRTANSHEYFFTLNSFTIFFGAKLASYSDAICLFLSREKKNSSLIAASCVVIRMHKFLTYQLSLFTLPRPHTQLNRLEANVLA